MAAKAMALSADKTTSKITRTKKIRMVLRLNIREESTIWSSIKK
jgi:hypothetical protein